MDDDKKRKKKKKKKKKKKEKEKEEEEEANLHAPYGRNIGRRLVVMRSTCSRIGVELRSNRSRLAVVTGAL